MRERTPAIQVATVAPRYELGSPSEWRQAYVAWLKRRQLQDMDWQTTGIQFRELDPEAIARRTARLEARRPVRREAYTQRRREAQRAKIVACAAMQPIFTANDLARWYGGSADAARHMLSVAERNGWVRCLKRKGPGKPPTSALWALNP